VAGAAALQKAQSAFRLTFNQGNIAAQERGQMIIPRFRHKPDMLYLLTIPAALAGFIIGTAVLGLAPALVATITRWGAEAYMHPEWCAAAIRPAGIAGGLIGAIVAAAMIHG
jgi:hypothetical protein